MEIEIRQATVDDVDELMEWRTEALHDAFRDVDDEILWARVAAASNSYFTLAMLDGSQVFVFAEFLGEPVGCAGMCIQQEMPSPANPTGKCARLESIYTRAPYRGHGVAKRMAEWLVAEAKAQECGRICIDAPGADRDDFAEIGFLEPAGMMVLE